MVKRNETLGEALHISQLSNGLKCYIIPKAGYVEKQAMITVRFGSADTVYSLNGKTISKPEGIAHFLEHKLFEDKEDDLFNRFSQIGGNVNAFTAVNQTSFYVSCIENFDENLKLLLSVVQNPWVTDEGVEKEKPIIAQEIQMYDDMPSWRAYMGLNAAMFGESPVSASIAGSAASIEGIRKSDILDCYHAFYFPSNMALVCVGDFDPDMVEILAEWKVKPAGPRQLVRGYAPDASGVYSAYAETFMPVSMPLFELGFKETDFHTPLCERIVSSKILLDVIAGESSELYGRMYNGRLIDSFFGMDYLSGDFYGLSVFSGSSPEPCRVREEILGEVRRLKENGLDRRRFEAVKRKHIGGFTRAFNSIERIAQTQADLYVKGLDIFQLMDCFLNITYEEAEARLARHFTECALSVAKPLA